MRIESIFGRSMPILEGSLKLRMARQTQLASNIANAETPGYRAADINFKETMAQLVRKVEAEREAMPLAQTHPEHFAAPGPEAPTELDPDSLRIVYQANDGQTIGNDSNTVDLEVELARMQSNSMFWSATTQIVGRRFKGLMQILESTSRA